MFFENQIEAIYRSNLFVRNDNAGGIFYYGPADFPGLQTHAYRFPSSMGHDLQGWFYHYGSPIPGRLIVFDHGMGNGHRAYMCEIERLANHGYLVFSYDHTGCMASGGDSTNGFSQSLADLDDCMKALKAEPALAGRTFSVVGHSWGGFSTMNITALHPQITHVVSMCGFISVRQIISQTFGGILKSFRKSIFALEQRANPNYVNYNAVNSLASTSAKVLLIYSDDDSMVHKAFHYDPLYAVLSGKPNIRFLLLSGKDHNPTYTDDAVQYKNLFFKDYTHAMKKKLLQTPQQQKAFMARYDFARMTRQDDAVWAEIFAALDA